MIFPKAKKIARDLGWHKTSHKVFGLYKGYFFNVSDASIIHTPQYKYVSVTTGNLTEEQRQQIKTELTGNRKKLRFTLFEIRENTIFFKFTENIMPTKISTVYALFDFVVGLLKKLNVLVIAVKQMKVFAITTLTILVYSFVIIVFNRQMINSMK